MRTFDLVLSEEWLRTVKMSSVIWTKERKCTGSLFVGDLAYGEKLQQENYEGSLCPTSYPTLEIRIHVPVSLFYREHARSRSRTGGLAVRIGGQGSAFGSLGFPSCSTTVQTGVRSLPDFRLPELAPFHRTQTATSHGDESGVTNIACFTSSQGNRLKHVRSALSSAATADSQYSSSLLL